VTAMIHRFRGPLVAIVALVFTAGVTFAGGGPAPAADGGLATAREASGKLVPVRAGQAEEETEEPIEEETEEPIEEETEEPIEEETEEPEELEELVEDAEHCTDVDPVNHGALACWAAQNTPEAWTGNQGEWVSCVARLSNEGHTVEPAEGEVVEPIVWTDLTPEACTEALEAAKAAKTAEREAARAERELARADRADARADRAAARADKVRGPRK
jgi:hypothetical protein